MDMLPEIFDDVFDAEDSFSDANRTLMLIVDDLKDLGNINGEYVETDYNRLALLSTVGGNILSVQHYPQAGDTVHIIVEPKEGYVLNCINVIDADGNSIQVQKEDDRDYTFLMPEPNVRVEAYFSYQDVENETEETDSLTDDENMAGKDEVDKDAVESGSLGVNNISITDNGNSSNNGMDGDAGNQANTDGSKTDGETNTTGDKTGSGADAAGSKTDGEANTTGDNAGSGTDAAGSKADGETNTAGDNAGSGADIAGDKADNGTNTTGDNSGSGADITSDKTGSGADITGDKTGGGTNTADDKIGSGASTTDGKTGSGVNTAGDNAGSGTGTGGGTADRSSGKTEAATSKTNNETNAGGNKEDSESKTESGQTESGREANPSSDNGTSISDGAGNADETFVNNQEVSANNQEVSAPNQEVRRNRFEYTSTRLMSAGIRTLTKMKTIASPIGSREPEELFEEPEALFKKSEDTSESPAGAAKTIIKLSSNLSGNASCEIEGTTATLTVIPDGAYTVSGTPTVMAGGEMVSVAGSSKSEYAYTFNVSSGGVYQVNIVFKKLDKSQAVNSAKGDISSAVKEQQAAAERVNAIIKEIQDSSNVSTEQLNELTKALEEMSNATSAVLSNLSVVSNIAGQQALDKMEDIGSDMSTALDYLQEAVDSVKLATRDAKSIVDYVNGQPDIHFSKLGGAFSANRENLHDQLKGMSDSIKNLSNSASDYSDVVNDDLRAVNDQINVIFNLLMDNITNYGDISVEELYEDVDIADIESITTGKTNHCTNKGIIQGDINVGGIAGAMSIDEEDPEGSAAGSIEYRIGRRYFTKCIITESVNEGYITAKKDGAGGIVGYMRHGVVVDSEGYGSVESTEGDYVGGICGESFTMIKRCYALCSVSGGKNVGGIAGFADTLKDCYAIVDCNASIGRKGAIAGQTANYDDALNEEEVRVSGNYYVGDNLYGIDNISYTGIAEPMSYEELLTTANLPTEFRHLKVTYRVEDLYLGVQEVKFGESLSKLDYPQIPEKEGYYGVWPDYSDKVMTGNLLIKGEYKEDVTVVQSNEKQISEAEGEREKPYALVEQRFTEDTVLNVSISDMMPPEKALNKENVIYDITLENAQIKGTDTFAIRLYNPYEDAKVWGYKDGTWSELESKVRGQYLQVDMTGAEQSFCVAEQKSRIWVVIAGVAAGLAVLALLTAVVKNRKQGIRGGKKEKV